MKRKNAYVGLRVQAKVDDSCDNFTKGMLGTVVEVKDRIMKVDWDYESTDRSEDKSDWWCCYDEVRKYASKTNNLKIIAEYGRDYGIVGTPTGMLLNGVELCVGDVVVAEGFEPQFVAKSFDWCFVYGRCEAGSGVFIEEDFSILRSHKEIKVGDEFGYLKVVENGK